MLSGPQPRAHHLRSLSIEVTTFCTTNATSSLDPDFEELYASDFSQAPLIGDLLLSAQNLTELALERFQPCLLKDSRIGSALQSMSQLTNLRLSTLGDGALSVLRSCKADIRRLTLSYYVEDDWPLDGETKTVPVLLSALTPFRNLHILKLWNFTPELPLPVGFDAPELLSLSYLRLSESTAYALDVVRLCPNLSTLIYSADPEVSVPKSPPAVGVRWRPLRRLMIGAHDEIPSVLHNVSLVEKLHISGEMLSSGVDDEEIAHLIEFVRASSPVELFLSVVIRSSALPFLTEVARAAPRLRILELKVSLPSPDLVYEGWLDNLAASLQHLNVPCLRIYLPTFRLAYQQSLIDDNDDDSEQRARLKGAIQMEARRTYSIRTLPQRLAETLQSLRYLCILDGGPNLGILTLLEDGEVPFANTTQETGIEEVYAAEVAVSDTDSFSSGNEEGQSTRTVYEWDELRRTDRFHSVKWWQVIGDADGRRVKRISTTEGERTQQQLIDSAQQQPLLAERMSSLSL
ncbi:hypothetical protein BN946_scf184939.g16 [Trametes cinnabarina]|uniref:F-box domain-containing protein n=1 Tax=Pycnoporus cinnabarinus TaxID=5643 RepID=A0A060SBG3_PYCCI|nr:hypothetical protein BN946_scf184939.g16 [Trametes cinnabarina]